MNMPQFNAEASLGPSIGTYYGGPGYGRADGTRIVPSQTFGRLDVFPLMRCCGYVPSLGRFVSTSRRAFPFENCQCRRDIFGYPIILCEGPVLSSD